MCRSPSRAGKLSRGGKRTDERRERPRAGGRGEPACSPPRWQRRLRAAHPDSHAELRALELAILGWSQHQIADDLGISQPAVSKILKRIDTRILAELAGAVERHKVRHTQRLEYVFAEAMRAWTESKADTTRRRQRRSQGAGSGTGDTVAEVVVENQHGDPRYLEEARKALADSRKIWGLDAPQQLNVRATRDPYEGMTEEDLREEVARQARLLGESPPVSAEAVSSDYPSTEAIPATPSPAISADSSNEEPDANHS